MKITSLAVGLSTCDTEAMTSSNGSMSWKLSRNTAASNDAGRALLAGEGMPWGDLLRAGLGGLAMLGLAAWFAARMLRTFRERGFVTRYS